jgi:hypothetical protein
MREGHKNTSISSRRKQSVVLRVCHRQMRLGTARGCGNSMGVKRKVQDGEVVVLGWRC